MKKILILDDDALTLQLYDLLFEDMEELSYQTAENGSTALAYLEQCAPAEWPDLIFIDLFMPDMSGYEFIEKFQENFKSGKKECRLYILTSSVSHRDQEMVENYPIVRSIIRKPLTEDSLKKIIAEDSKTHI